MHNLANDGMSAVSFNMLAMYTGARQSDDLKTSRVVVDSLCDWKPLTDGHVAEDLGSDKLLHGGLSGTAPT